MALTPILMAHLFRTASLLIAGATLFALFALGAPEAVGIAIGGTVMALSGGGLIYLTGKLLDPQQGGMAKLSFMALMLLKVAGVFGILFLAIAVYDVPTLGLVIGMGVGLAATVVGVSRGSSSPEGQQVMAASESEMGDSERDSR